MDIEEKVDFLKTTEILGSVPEPVLRELCAKMNLVILEEGATIFSDGDPAQAVFIIADGYVGVEKEGVTVAICGPGEWLGELAVLDDSPRSASAVTKTDAALLRLDRSDFQRALQLAPQIVAGISRNLSKKVREYTTTHAHHVKESGVAQTGPTKHVYSLQPSALFANRFVIERELSEGGFAKVYKALDRILRIPVALKVMVKVSMSEPEVIQRFKREVILARRVSHPNACRMYDLGEHDGLYYVTMEYLEGTTLKQMLEQLGALSPSTGLPIIRQVLDALREAHRAGVIHRDVKPQNIMVTGNNHAYLMDFGISISADVSRHTEAGDLVGTPRYMSPEQFQELQIDQRSDLYSLGLVMFEAFTGSPPFSGTSMWKLMDEHLRTEPPQPSQFSKEISPELERIILKAMQKDPEKRYQDASEMIRDIDRL